MRFITLARNAGDSDLRNLIDTVIDATSLIMKGRITESYRPPRGLDGIGYALLLGFRAVALHPRLYSGACSAG